MRSRLDTIHSRHWIDLAFKARFNTAELSRHCGVSRRQLERYFGEAFHVTPKFWIQKLRMSVAAQHIIQNQSEKEIAFTLAFANVPHFIREFKRHYGCTPKQYLHIERARSAARSGSSPEMRELESAYQKETVHPRDARSLLDAHRQRMQTLDLSGIDSFPSAPAAPLMEPLYHRVAASPA